MGHRRRSGRIAAQPRLRHAPPASAPRRSGPARRARRGRGSRRCRGPAGCRGRREPPRRRRARAPRSPAPRCRSRGRTPAPPTASPSAEKIASRTRSEVGRAFSPTGREQRPPFQLSGDDPHLEFRASLAGEWDQFRRSGGGRRPSADRGGRRRASRARAAGRAPPRAPRAAAAVLGEVGEGEARQPCLRVPHARRRRAMSDPPRRARSRRRSGRRP